MRVTRLMLSMVVVGCLTLAAWGQTEKVVEIPSCGQNIRALLLSPEKPVASVILLAGGNGDLGLTPDGKIKTSLANGILVRSRQDYAEAGMATLVPDIARNTKRISAEHAQDLGALVKQMRSIAGPVVVIGFGSGAISAANAVANLTGSERPDAMVLASASLLGGGSVEAFVDKQAKRLVVPTLVVVHRDDKCPRTPPSDAEPFQRWLATGGQKVDTAFLTGGPQGYTRSRKSNETQECLSPSVPHNFHGMENEFVTATCDWVKKLAK